MSWRDHLHEFVCHRCGNCCKGGGRVCLNRHDIRRIAEHLGMSQVDFLRANTRRSDRRTILLDQPGPERACIFYGGDDVGCRINAVKPRQCADYPVRWRNDDSIHDCEGLRALAARVESRSATAVP